MSRALGQADFVHVDADRLYALSRYRGLSIIDVSNPTSLAMLGEYVADATPFEMYVEGAVVYLMFGRWPSYVCDSANLCKWVTETCIQALDVRDPAHVQLVAEQKLPGALVAARRTGNILYLATAEPPSCYGCQEQPNTAIRSFELSGDSPLRQLSQVRVPFLENQRQQRVAVAEQRMYIARHRYDAQAQRMSSSSVVVVDISDRGGALALGASFEVGGTIESSSQMDEYGGVFRVLSQPGGWSRNEVPVLQTFRVRSSNEVQLAGSVAVPLPQPNELNVRFDGTRGFTSTSYLDGGSVIIFDLSAPEIPLRVEVPMPGGVQHLEPHGDRLLVSALGSDGPEGPLSMSLFDIQNLAAPQLLSRTAFGSTWVDFGTAQQLGTRPFLVLSEQNLLLVPFDAHVSDGASWDLEPLMGIALFDVTDTSLTPRATLPHGDDLRRLLLHGERVLAVSDFAAHSIDVGDHDAPLVESSLEMARNVTSVNASGTQVLRFGTDISGGEQRLEVTEPSRVSDVLPQGELKLSTLTAARPFRSNTGGSRWRERVLRRDVLSYLIRDSSGADIDTGEYQQWLDIVVLDVTDPQAPVAIGNVAVGPLAGDSYFNGVLQTDSALLVGRAPHAELSATTPGFMRRSYGYDIIDIRDPAAPVLAGRFEVPEALATRGWAWPVHTGLPYTWDRSTRSDWLGGETSSGELTAGSLVVSQHAELLEGDATRVKFYLDRLDVSDPSAPRLLSSINIPGSVLRYDPEKREVVTFGYKPQRHVASSADECVPLGYTASSFDGTACVFQQPSLNVVALDGDRAVRQSEVQLDPKLGLQALAVSESRVFLMTSESAGYLEPAVIMLQSFRVEAGQLLSLPAQELRRSGADGRFWSEFHARGDRALSFFDHVLTVVDTSDPNAPTRVVRPVPHSNCTGFDISADALYCPAGPSRVEVIDLSAMP